jgi:hypothetical protein
MLVMRQMNYFCFWWMYVVFAFDVLVFIHYLGLFLKCCILDVDSAPHPLRLGFPLPRDRDTSSPWNVMF